MKTPRPVIARTGRASRMGRGDLNLRRNHALEIAAAAGGGLAMTVIGAFSKRATG